ncbi:hypothetical protein [Streptococcus agalactiae]|uniref:hypothetical protein n=1 Tax=Streptococcus agalactiae TaxID=1311 RepID=UPI0024B903F1|nr:hypothetical protein [Streptococcus agalactiae]
MSRNTEIKIDKKTSFKRALLILSNEDSKINHLINGEIFSIKNRVNRYFIQGDSDKDARRGLYNRIENRKEHQLINKNYSIILDKYYLSYFYNIKNRTLILYNIEKISENKRKPWIILALLVLLFLQTILSLVYFLWLFCFKQNFLVTSTMDKRLILILILLAGAIYSVVRIPFLLRNEWTKKRWTVYPKSIFGKLKVWNLEASVNKISTKALAVITIILFIQLLLSTFFPLLQPQNVISQIFDAWKYVLYILLVVFISVAYFIRGISFRVLTIGGVIFYIAGLLDTSA